MTFGMSILGCITLYYMFTFFFLKSCWCKCNDTSLFLL